MQLRKDLARLPRTHCIGCGCHDLAACCDEDGGQACHWLAVDRQAGLGVCSACPEELTRWQQGDRELAVPVARAGAPADRRFSERANGKNDCRIVERSDQREQRVATVAGPHPVPSAWQGEACRQFDEEMAQRMGGQYDRAQELFSRIESAKDRLEDIRWDGRTPGGAQAKEEKELKVGIAAAESWLHENVYLNPVIKERMYPVVQNRSINLTDDIVAYLGEMKAQLGEARCA